MLISLAQRKLTEVIFGSLSCTYFCLSQTGTTKLIYAYHPDDPVSENAIPQHSPTNRGPRSVLMLNSAEKEPTLPPDTKHFDITQNKVTSSVSHNQQIIIKRNKCLQTFAIVLKNNSTM